MIPRLFELNIDYTTSTVDNTPTLKKIYTEVAYRASNAQALLPTTTLRFIAARPYPATVPTPNIRPCCPSTRHAVPSLQSCLDRIRR